MFFIVGEALYCPLVEVIDAIFSVSVPLFQIVTVSVFSVLSVIFPIVTLDRLNTRFGVPLQNPLTLIVSGVVTSLLAMSIFVVDEPIDVGINFIVSINDPFGGMFFTVGEALYCPFVEVMFVILSVSVPLFQIVTVSVFSVLSVTLPIVTLGRLNTRFGVPITIKIWAFDVPPPGVGLNTVMLYVSAVVISLAGIVAVNCVELT
jgi:hypothetical protein